MTRDRQDPLAHLDLDGLSPEKRRLLELLLEQGDLADPQPHETTCRTPLSYGQEWFWLLDELDRGRPTYSVPLGFTLRGAVDVAVLAVSLRTIVQRHDSLRTLLRADGDTSWTEVEDVVGNVLEIHDLRSRDNPRASLEAHVQRTIQRPFSLSEGPLFRFSLTKVENDEWYLLLVFHHIAVDGFSLRLFLDELQQLYSAGGNPAVAQLPDLALSHAQYAAREREGVTQDWRPALEFWGEQVTAPTPRPVFSGGNIDAGQGRGERVRVSLGRGLSDEVSRFARNQETTPYAVLLAAFGALLSRYGRSSEAVVATAVTRRTREVSHLIGPFANTLPVRIRDTASGSFREVVQQTSTTLREGAEHQDVPFVLLNEDLRRRGIQDPRSLYRATIVLHAGGGFTLSLPCLESSTSWLDTGATDADLYLVLEERPDGLVGMLGFDHSVMDRAAAEAFFEQYILLLTAGLRRSSVPLEEIPLVSGHDEDRLLEELSHVGPHPSLTSMPIALERSAEANWNRVAVAMGDDVLTYGELLKHGDRVARDLASRGIGPGCKVGISYPRSISQIVALWGVVRSGAAYVPLDLGYPSDRLRFMTEDAGVDLVLGPPDAVDFVALKVEVVDLVQRGSETDNEAALPAVSEDDTAYVIYTSGSSGNPKGVAVSHRSLAWYASVANATYGGQQGDRWLQFSSLCFDASVEEIFTPLLCGASIVLRTDQMLTSPKVFLENCEAFGVTVLSLATSYWHVLTAALGRGEAALPTCLHTVIIGGEQASEEALRTWRRVVQTEDAEVRLFNGYGPTETTVGATVGLLHDRVTLGRPLPGVRCYVVDDDLRPVPLGMVGELLIAGPGVAQGYLNQPDLTGQRFIPNPFHSGRCYRTGDLARFRRDGSLEFVGRDDGQIQHRGYRIELGEIEKVAERHPAIDQAVARYWPRQKRISLHVVGSQLTSDTVGSFLSPHLRKRLPDYMIPTAYVVLPEVPRTPAGKVDRTAMTPPAWEAGARFVPPRNEEEKIVADVWAEVTGQVVGALDDFFQLGGHSLLAIRAAGKIEKRIGRHVPLRMIFDAPTVVELAARLREAPGAPPRTQGVL